MKKSRFTGEQIAFALRQPEVGTALLEVCREMEATFYRWKQLYGGLGPIAHRDNASIHSNHNAGRRIADDVDEGPQR